MVKILKGIRTLFFDLLDVVIPPRRRRAQAAKRRQSLFLMEYANLAALKTISWPNRTMRSLDESEIQGLFNDAQLAKEWKEIGLTLQGLHLPEMTGGVNPGDQRTLYYLIRALRPRKILEIGTYIACSTVNMALAAKRLGGVSLLSIDARDVNDEVKCPWKGAGAKYSPRQMIEQLGCDSFVRFYTSPSLDFLQQTHAEEEFDFIFLDGDHAAETVYRELPAAMNRLSKNGVLLLHDFFPNLQPLWSDGSVIPGVYLAVQRLRNEGANFQIQPLGTLPWPTKLGSNVTSLALVAQRSKT